MCATRTQIKKKGPEKPQDDEEEKEEDRTGARRNDKLVCASQKCNDGAWLVEKDGVSQGCVENPDKKAEADRIAQDNERRKNLGLNRNQYKKYTAIEEELKNLEGLSGAN